jgi:predicted transcriptional regulator
VMALVTRGMLNKQIAMDLGVTEFTVKVHRRAAMKKMRARSLAELVRMADALGDHPSARNAGSGSAQFGAAADHRKGYTLAPC